MQNIINSRDIDNYIENLFDLLSKQDYYSLGVELTREERKKLFTFFYSYDMYGMEKENFKRFWGTRKAIDLLALNRLAFNQADDELKKIIIKCGANPNKIFILKNGHCEIDNNILVSMYNNGILDLGDYVIKTRQDHPVDRDSEEINHFMESFREKKYLRAKDGERTFTIYEKTKGKLRKKYHHSDGIHFGGLITFNGAQIGGNFGMRGYSFCFYQGKGMMYMDIGRAKWINELIPFFKEMHNILTNNLANEEVKHFQKSH